LSVDDTELVTRAQRGDVEAFAALTATRTRRLYSAARMIVRDDELASDVVQEALFRAWRDLKALREPDRFDAWLRRILVRGCYHAARRRSRGVVEIALALDVEPPDRADTVDAIAAVAVRDQLERAFGRLSPEQRAAITLHFYLGLTLSEAADALGVPPGTMASRLSRALRTMRSAVEADDRTPFLAPEAIR
jgi:RNA polymerase sigma-70 factor (ECF subfamily)